MTGTANLGGRTVESRGGKNKPTSSERSIQNRDCAVIKKLSSKPQIVEVQGGAKTKQETVVTLNGSTSFSSSKVNQKEPGETAQKSNKVLTRYPLRARTEKDAMPQISNEW